jgi:Tol biopolymer transport system component
LLVQQRHSGAPVRIAGYDQITHDGRLKSLVGTDGSRLYFNQEDAQPPAEVAIAGGEIAPISIAIPNAILLGVSPDGSTFLVGSQSVGQTSGYPLWSAGVLGGTPRSLADSVTSAAWAADGKSAAYASPDGDIFQVGNKGAEKHKLGAIGGRTDWLAWSPNDASIRFSTNDQLRELSVKTPTSKDLLKNWQSGSGICCGSWSPDGAFFYFLLDGQIWALDERSSLFGLGKPSHTPIQLTSGPISWGNPVPGKGGKKLFATGLAQRGELSRFDPKSKQFQPYLAGISADLVSFSKDGKSIAYISYPDGGLWKADRDGRKAVELVDPSLHPLLPAWSPDGSQIVFVGSLHKDNVFRSYIVPSAGGDAQRLLPGDNGAQTDPNFSPDGNSIVFSTSELGGRNPKSLVRILSFATHEVSTLPGSQGLFSPRWSPDGRSIAASTFDQGSINLFDIKTRRWRVLHQGIVAFPVWSADSSSIYFLTYVDDPGVFRLRIADGSVERIFSVKDFHYTGNLGSWLGLDPSDAPLMLRDIGTHDIYALTLEEQ